MKYFLLSLLTYKGRHNRKQFIVSQLTVHILFFLPITLAAHHVRQTYGFGLASEEFQQIFAKYYHFIIILPVVFAYLNLVSYIKRLHDLGLTGRWVLLMLIPVVNSIFILFLTIKEGMPGANKYGPPPLQNTGYARQPESGSR